MPAISDPTMGDPGVPCPTCGVGLEPAVIAHGWVTLWLCVNCDVFVVAEPPREVSDGQ